MWAAEIFDNFSTNHTTLDPEKPKNFLKPCGHCFYLGYSQLRLREASNITKNKSILRLQASIMFGLNGLSHEPYSHHTFDTKCFRAYILGMFA